MTARRQPVENSTKRPAAGENAVQDAQARYAAAIENACDLNTKLVEMVRTNAEAALEATTQIATPKTLPIYPWLGLQMQRGSLQCSLIRRESSPRFGKTSSLARVESYRPEEGQEVGYRQPSQSSSSSKRERTGLKA